MTRLQAAHRLISIAVAFAVPLAVYLVNGTVEVWAFVLGAVVGFCWWCFFPVSPTVNVRRRG